jgi:hypothetical protein
MRAILVIIDRLVRKISRLKKKVFSNDRSLILGLVLIWLYTMVGFCLSFLTNNLGLGILFILIFIPIYHWNLANLGISNQEVVLTVVCSLPTVLAISWLLCLNRPVLSPIAAIAASFTMVGYSYTTIEVSGRYFGKNRAIAIVTLVSCIGLILGWFWQNCLA